MGYITVGILGLLIGSFLNVCIYRIPREESISYPPSHCGNCNHKLGALDLIPLFSFLFLKGRCRYCKEKISLRYPLIECLNAAIYILIYLMYGDIVLTAKYCLLTSLLIVIGCIDFNTQYVYTSTTIFGGIIGLLFCIGQAIFFKEDYKNLLFGALIGILTIGLIVFITKGMGEGDIEIAGVCGLFLGIKGIIFTLFIGIIIAGFVGIIVLLSKIKGAKDKMAFGPFLSTSAIVYILYGNQLIEMYFKYILHM